jgi:hypothetical protein
MTKFLFVGEKPSKTAYEKNWTWADGQLAAKQLFDALKFSDIPALNCGFINLFGNHHECDEVEDIEVIDYLKLTDDEGMTTIVGMGEKVAKLLRKHAIVHKKIVHPAARGKIRGKEIYCAHVKAELIG